MDSLTHVYFADKLLQISGGDRSAAVASLFPQIDREPAYFHRMYGHPFFQIRRLAAIGAGVYGTGRIDETTDDPYPWHRFSVERPRMRKFVQDYERETGEVISPLTASIEDVILAFVSHTYQDVFNNPMQGFLPYHVYPCGKWELWNSFDDPIAFRTVLYRPENISAFREEFFGDEIWKSSIDSVALICAMVERTAASCLVRVPERVISAAVRSLDGGSGTEQSHADEALEWLLEHESMLERLIHKYSSETRTFHVGAPRTEMNPYPVGS